MSYTSMILAVHDAEAKDLAQYSIILISAHSVCHLEANGLLWKKQYPKFYVYSQ